MPGMLTALIGLKAVLGLQLTVEGDCPTAAAVQARLQPLLGSELPAQSTARASIELLDELLRVEVRDGDGALLSVRDHRRSEPCADLAAWAAVVIASAVQESHRPLTLPQVLLEPPPPPPLPPPPPPPRPRPQLEAGVGVVLSSTASGLAPGGLIELQTGPAQQAWALKLAVAATWPTSLPLPQGTALWTRPQLLLGPRYRLWRGRLAVDLSPLGALALVYTQGQGLPVTQQSLGVDVGVGGSVRLGWPQRQWSPWLQLQATSWLRPQELWVQGLPDAEPTRLPRFELQLSLGLSAGRLR